MVGTGDDEAEPSFRRFWSLAAPMVRKDKQEILHGTGIEPMPLATEEMEGKHATLQ